MVSISARRGLVSLLVALVWMPMGCAVAPSGPVKPKGKSPRWRICRRHWRSLIGKALTDGLLGEVKL